MAPKMQILIDQKDIFLTYKMTPASIVVESGFSAKFMIDNASALIDSALFKVGLALTVKMGYANVIETVFEGKISAVKTVFPDNGPPHIQVLGKETTSKRGTADTVIPLSYGSTLNSFVSTTSEDIEYRDSCVVKCVGLPDIKAGIMVAIGGLGSQFNKRYLVEKTTHTFDCVYGFNTQFEAKSFDLIEKGDLSRLNSSSRTAAKLMLGSYTTRKSI